MDDHMTEHRIILYARIPERKIKWESSTTKLKISSSKHSGGAIIPPPKSGSNFSSIMALRMEGNSLNPSLMASSGSTNNLNSLCLCWNHFKNFPEQSGRHKFTKNYDSFWFVMSYSRVSYPDTKFSPFSNIIEDRERKFLRKCFVCRRRWALLKIHLAFCKYTKWVILCSLDCNYLICQNINWKLFHKELWIGL